MGLVSLLDEMVLCRDQGTNENKRKKATEARRDRHEVTVIEVLGMLRLEATRQNGIVEQYWYGWKMKPGGKGAYQFKEAKRFEKGNEN